jgi:uncharacterized protein (DUF927 family)
METFISGAGKKVKAGQLVRLLNIPMNKAIKFHGYQNGKQHADALKMPTRIIMAQPGANGFAGWRVIRPRQFR